MTRSPLLFESNSPRTIRPWVLNAGALLFYIVATWFMLFPQPLYWNDRVRDLGDPLFDAYIFARNAYTLLDNPTQLFHLNIFYPYPNAAAFSENEIASSLLALPFFQFTGNAIFAYNVVYFFSFVLCGFTMYLLAYDLTRQRVGALLGGFAFAFWSYRMQHWSHLNLLTLQYMPLVLFALRRAWDSGKWKFAALFAIALVLQILSSWYAALILVIGLGLFGVYLLFTRRRDVVVKKFVPLFIASAIAAAIVLPLGLPYFQINREFEFARSIADQERFSARPETFFSVAQNSWLYRNVLPIDRNEPLFAGALILILAILGAVTHSNVRERAFWILLLFVSAILALGPTLQLSESSSVPLPFRLLFDYFPGFQGMRAPARFFILGMLGLSVLAAGGAGWLLARVRISKKIALAVGIFVLAIEYNVAPLQLVPFAAGEQTPQVYRWLRQQPQGNVLELPHRIGSTPQIASAMVYSTVHWHTLPYGYGSFIPPAQTDFLFTVNTALENPSPRLPNVLREFDVRYVIVNNAFGEQAADKIRAAFAQLPMFESVYRDETYQVFRISSDAPDHPLQFDCLAPAYTAPNAPYIAYLIAQHARRYPIVNDDLQTHEIKWEWRAQNNSRLTQTQSLYLPYVLRERVEGVPVQLTAPNVSGDYELRCTLDGATEPLHTQRVRVDSAFQTNTASSSLELLQVKTAPSVPQRGGEIIAIFFWRRRAQERAPIVMRVRLLDENNLVRAELLRQPILFTYPVRMWRENELVADSYALPIPQDTPIGKYRVTISALDERTNTPLTFINPRGETTAEFSAESFTLLQ